MKRITHFNSFVNCLYKKMECTAPHICGWYQIWGSCCQLEDRKIIQRNFLTCWRSEPRNPHKVCLRKYNVLFLRAFKCLQQLDANWSWQFCNGKKEKRKNGKTKGKIFVSCRASWIWVSGESLQWLKLTWYWAKPGGMYQKRLSLLLSVCETTPGAPQTLLGSPAQKRRYWQTGISAT